MPMTRARRGALPYASESSGRSANRHGKREAKQYAVLGTPISVSGAALLVWRTGHRIRRDPGDHRVRRNRLPRAWLTLGSATRSKLIEMRSVDAKRIECWDQENGSPSIRTYRGPPPLPSPFTKFLLSSTESRVMRSRIAARIIHLFNERQVTLMDRRQLIEKPLRLMSWGIYMWVGGLVLAAVIGANVDDATPGWAHVSVLGLVLTAIVVGFWTCLINMGILASRTGKSGIIYVGLSVIVPVLGVMIMYSMLRRHAIDELKNHDIMMRTLSKPPTVQST